MEYIQSLNTRAKLIIIILSIFIVSMTVGLLAFGVDIKGDSIHMAPMHNITSDMIMVPQGEKE
ncbi:MAG: hypothetical protein ACD_65C00346G0005 [uncultured bacterium]|nr:MAG: hypothetical protein ACD_65C00346G0005 [uncultured bacterium]KKT02593.1 MAG: hypothetical protein UV80_C0002G0060 [Candidatus Peregrinibacteria bacterium GW2011_GWF2_43_17]HAU39893.1 hypothetical protein [Candidatus Peregrinibacteria bacterium]